MDFFPTNFMLQTPQSADHHHHQPSTTLSPLFPSQTFHGGGGKRSIKYCEEALLSRGDMQEVEVSEDEEEEGSQVGENNKKRRLNTEQVKALEKSFEVGNKLEPERKMKLARALGLQPRQIAIWFQNRRARWKTKQLERDYDSLKRQFDAVKAENHALLANNQKLHAQIMALKNRRRDSSIHHHHHHADEPTESINLNKETDQAGSCSNRSDENSSEIKQLDISATIDSHHHHHHHRRRPPPTHHHHHGISSSSSDHLIHHTSLVKEEMSLSNIFCTTSSAHDDHSAGFWPTWLDHNQHHFN